MADYLLVIHKVAGTSPAMDSSSGEGLTSSQIGNMKGLGWVRPVDNTSQYDDIT